MYRQNDEVNGTGLGFQLFHIGLHYFDPGSGHVQLPMFFAGSKVGYSKPSSYGQEGKLSLAMRSGNPND
jgi:hypothetical protein